MHSLSQVDISRLTSFQNAGVVPEVVVLESVEDAIFFVGQKRPFRMLGRGSNSVIRPNIMDTVLVKVSPDAVPVHVEDMTLTVSAGVPVNRLMQLMQDAELGGLEFSAGVPASVGGMVAMNFGCWGYEISSFLKSVLVVKSSGEAVMMDPQELEFSYRSSIFHRQPWIVMAATFLLKPTPRDEIKKEVLARIQERLAKQPLRGKTFGSTFKNPHHGFAGQILDELGYRGKSFGNLQLSDQHANFMLNTNNATFEDVYSALELIRNDVRARKGIELEPEVCFLP
jgi:UDP-N-acetylmuramate dehydrogenase